MKHSNSSQKYVTDKEAMNVEMEGNIYYIQEGNPLLSVDNVDIFSHALPWTMEG